MNESPTFEVFISYAREDWEAVQAIVAILNRRAIASWVDVDRINFASRWRDEISHALARSQLVLVIVTRDAVQSAACQVEWEQAHALGKRVLPVVSNEVADTDVPLVLADYHWMRVQALASLDADTVAATVAASLSANPAELRFHADITARAVNWALNPRDAGGVLRGSDLRTAIEWLKRTSPATETRSQMEDASEDSLRLGVQARAFVIASQAARTRRQFAVFASTLVVAILLVAAAGLTLLSRRDADTQRLYAIRGQLAVLSTDHDVEGIVKTLSDEESTKLAATDAISTLYGQFAKSDYLRLESSEALAPVSWLSVQGDWVLVSGLGRDELRHVATLKARPAPDAIRDHPHRIALSLNGRHAVYASGRRAVKVALDGSHPNLLLSIPGGATVADIDNSGQNGWLQSLDSCVAVQWRNQTDGLSSAFPLHTVTGCSFVRRLTEEFVLLRMSLGPGRPLHQYVVAQVKDGRDGITMWPLDVPGGALRQVLVNEVDTLVVWINGSAYVFDLPGVQPKPGVLQARRRPHLPITTISIALANRHDRLATIRAGGEVEIHDISGGEEKGVVSAERPPSSVVHFLGDDHRSALRYGGTVYGETRIVFDVDDQRIYSGGSPAQVRDGLSGKVVANLSAAGDVTVANGNAAQAMFLSGDGRHLLTFAGVHGGRGEIKAASLQVPPRLLVRQTSALAAGWKGQQDILMTYDRGTVGFHDLTESVLSSKRLEHVVPATAAAFSPDGRRLVLAHNEGGISSWDVEAGTRQWAEELGRDDPAPWNHALPLDFNQNGERLLAASKYETSLIDATSGKVVCNFERIDSPYQGMASFFRIDYIVAVSMHFMNGTGWQYRDLEIRNIADCELAVPQEGLNAAAEEGRILQVGFGLAVRLDSMGYGWLIEPLGDGRSQILDLQSGTTVGYLQGAPAVLSIVPWPERGIMATGGQDGHVQLWDLETWRLLRSLPVGHCALSRISPSPSGRWLMAACANGPVYVWDLGIFSAPAAGRMPWLAAPPRVRLKVPQLQPKEWEVFKTGSKG